ncbi:hypothetical protein [Calothrix sp. NIES-3974]|uniref:hypothetical protein n=1 Tax=Calothrix sp. NIES-3974 TaxID=2005462 RepID=UPI0012FD68FB|nr:hypothetical protein [Calothrix sp. NIES-3974]
MQNPKLLDWVWVAIFTTISISNGWLLRTAHAPIPLVIFFGTFPLLSLVYKLIEHPLFLNISLIIFWIIIAFVIGNFQPPGLTIVGIIFYSINILFFSLVLLNILSNVGSLGYLLIFLFAIAGLFIFKITNSNWERSLRLIWYCNLMLSTNNAAIRFSQYFQSFSKAMLVLTAIASLGISLGWLLPAK